MQPDLQAELERLRKWIRDGFAPLAFLYDLRTYGGLAHTPNRVATGIDAANLGLPTNNWHRNDFLDLLNLIAKSVQLISDLLEAAAQLA